MEITDITISSYGIYIIVLAFLQNVVFQNSFGVKLDHPRDQRCVLLKDVKLKQEPELGATPCRYIPLFPL